MFCQSEYFCGISCGLRDTSFFLHSLISLTYFGQWALKSQLILSDVHVCKIYVQLCKCHYISGLLIGCGKTSQISRGFQRHQFAEKTVDFAGNSWKFLGQILLKNEWWKTADCVGIVWANFAGKWLVLHWFDKCF